MAINYSWVISQMEVKNSEGSLTDVVFVVHWRYQATEVDGDKTYFAETYSSTNLSAPDPADFTPYADLTKAQVEGWLEAVLPLQAMKDSLASQIEQQKNPQTSTPSLPWG